MGHMSSVKLLSFCTRPRPGTKIPSIVVESSRKRATPPPTLTPITASELGECPVVMGTTLTHGAVDVDCRGPSLPWYLCCVASQIHSLPCFTHGWCGRGRTPVGCIPSSCPMGVTSRRSKGGRREKLGCFSPAPSLSGGTALWWLHG